MSALRGSCPAVSFMVSDRTVTTDGDTKFEHGSCKSLQSGVKVEVKGRVQADDSVRATKIEIKKDDK